MALTFFQLFAFAFGGDNLLFLLVHGINVTATPTAATASLPAALAEGASGCKSVAACGVAKETPIASPATKRTWHTRQITQWFEYDIGKVVNLNHPCPRYLFGV